MEKTRFANLINDLSETAERGKWTTRYDKKLDYFYWTKEPLNKDSRLVKVSHETSFYVAPNRQIEGVFVEYLAGNFVEHNRAYKELVGQFNKKIDGNLYTVDNKKKAEKYLFGLGEALRADIYQDAEESSSIVNFDRLVDFAFSKKS